MKNRGKKEKKVDPAIQRDVVGKKDDLFEQTHIVRGTFIGGEICYF